jgi:DNA polymerase-3 subunit beta
LVEGITMVQNSVSSKSTTPFLEGILIEASEVLKFTGFNMEIGIECLVEADIIEKGSLVINSKLFGDIVKALPETEVCINVGKNYEVQIDAEGSRFDIKGLNADGFPPLPDVGNGMSFDISQKLLKDMIKKTVFAVGTEQHRMILTGGLVECNGNEIDIVAIDGFRVAWRKEYLEIENKPMKVVIPGKTLNELARILYQSEESIKAVMTKTHILFKTEKMKFFSRILEGEYLAYKSLIPTSFSTTVKINTKRLLESVERAFIVTGEEKNMYISLTAKGDKVILNANTENGTYTDDMKMIQEGEDINILFNPRYLLDALKAVQDDEMIKICFNSNVHPCVIKPVEGNNFAYMILPLRV